MEKDHLRRVEEQDQRSRLKKTAKQRARDEKLKIEADETSLSIREVYRKLVSALHPDREPDPQERARKTALMQRVNQAYGSRQFDARLRNRMRNDVTRRRTSLSTSEFQPLSILKLPYRIRGLFTRSPAIVATSRHKPAATPQYPAFSS